VVLAGAKFARVGTASRRVPVVRLSTAFD